MSQGINHYKTDLRDMHFLLFELYRLDALFGKEPYKEWAVDDAKMILQEVYKWSCEVIGPLNRSGDVQGCTLENGRVTTPDGFKKAWDSLYEAGWRQLAAPEEWGGSAAPFALAVLVGEMLSGANTAFNMYSGLTEGMAEVVEVFGSDEQKNAYLGKLHSGVYAGTMCLTEPHAGSDVGASVTKATPIGGGKYKIEGTKLYISGGDHDLTDNILHLVLARTADAPAGTKGLSLFIVPRDRLDGSGSNNVETIGIEHKMGVCASSTAQLGFGGSGDCIGELVGTEERKGMKQMFTMMNFARIGVGVQGLAVGSSAYLNALEYARDRKQGASIKNWKDPKAPRVAIVEHPNVRRMLLDMKSRVEGIRALIVKLAVGIDRATVARAEGDDAAAEKWEGQVDLLVPVVKAYASDQGFDIATIAIQVYGGAGYLQDHPVEQYARDAKIFSIYEGTNHIQALDLVGRKLGQKAGADLQAYVKEINEFVAANNGHEILGKEIALLGEAATAIMGSAMRFLGWSTGGKLELVPLAANRFLEMMAQTTVSWLLLESAVCALEAAEKLGEGDIDRDFYAGKRYAAQHFARTELPKTLTSARFLGEEDLSAISIPDGGFGRS